MKRTIILGIIVAIILVTFGIYSVTSIKMTGNQILSIGEVETIEIKNGGYLPETMKIFSGTTVEWINKDSIDDTLIIKNKEILDEELLNPGQKYYHTFDETGTYIFYSSLNSEKMGAIIVE